NYDNNPSGWNIFENTSIPTYWDIALFTDGTYWYTGTDPAYSISTPGTWNHLAMTDDGTNILLYVNAQVGNATTVAASGYSPQGLNGDVTVAGTNEVFGQRSDLENFGANAGMADVAFYNYALTPAQIQSHYLNSPSLTLSQVNGQSILRWSVGNLLGSTNVAGPWAAVSGATSPYPIPINGSQFFYVVGVPE
ncbi:MAG TPA: LamG-like jellyroll fold domain-containing protein, partial [Candidatus Cybelea sp.]|nr:LamG-like jellyroll fold domain-containing protein [Candidatus Cybelea sp.]